MMVERGGTSEGVWGGGEATREGQERLGGQRI